MTIDEKLRKARDIVPRKGTESWEAYYRRTYFRNLYARALYRSALHDLKKMQQKEGLSSSEMLLKAEIYEHLIWNAIRRYRFPEEQRYSELAREAYEDYFASGGVSCRAYYQYLKLLRLQLRDADGIFKTTDYLLKQDDDLRMIAHCCLMDDWLIGCGSFTRKDAREHWEAFKQCAVRTEENGRWIYRLKIGDFDMVVGLEAGSEWIEDIEESS